VTRSLLYSLSGRLLVPLSSDRVESHKSSLCWMLLSRVLLWWLSWRPFFRLTVFIFVRNVFFFVDTFIPRRFISIESNTLHLVFSRQAVRITAEDFIIKPCLPKSKTVMHSIKIKLPLLVPMKRIRERRINFKLKGEIYKIINLDEVPLNTTIVVADDDDLNGEN